MVLRRPGLKIAVVIILVIVAAWLRQLLRSVTLPAPSVAPPTSGPDQGGDSSVPPDVPLLQAEADASHRTPIMAATTISNVAPSMPMTERLSVATERNEVRDEWRRAGRPADSRTIVPRAPTSHEGNTQGPRARSVVYPQHTPRPVEPDFSWDDSGESLVGAAPWISSERLELYGPHGGHHPPVYITRPPEVKDLENWRGTIALRVVKPSGESVDLPRPSSSRVSLVEVLRGQESGYVELSLLGAGRAIAKIRFGYCAAIDRISTENDHYGSPFLVTRARSPLDVRFGTEESSVQVPSGESRTPLPTSVLTGSSACALRTPSGDWVYLRFSPWR